jgi:cysteinyl-tRNA synthetase
MAKSVGNIDKVRDLLDEFPGEALRLMLLRTHYRKPLEVQTEGLKETKRLLDRWYRAIEKQNLPPVPRNDQGEPIEEEVSLASKLAKEIEEALADDLNTAEAISKFANLVSSMDHERIEVAPRRYAYCRRLVEEWAAALGLLQQKPADWFSWLPKSAAAIDEAKIAEFIDLRLAARKAKNFKEADRIRDELAKQGVVLEDGPKGTTWRRAG